MLQIKNIDTINDFVDEVGLFENKKYIFSKKLKELMKKI